MTRSLFYQVSVKAGGVDYDLSHDLTSFSVEEERGKPDQLAIDISDPYKVFSHALQEGMEVEVDAGWTDDHSLIFRGHIYRVDGDFPKEGVPKLKLTAYDSSVKMGLRERNRPFTGTLKSIVAQVTKDYGEFINLHQDAVELDPMPEFPGNGIRQQDESDLAFLRGLGSTYGCELHVEPEPGKSVLYFDSLSTIMGREPATTVYHGRCGVAERLLKFKPNVDVSNIELPKAYCAMDYEQGTPLQLQEDEPPTGALIDDQAFDENWAAFAAEFPEKERRLDALISAAASGESLQQTLRAELGQTRRAVTPCFTTSSELTTRTRSRFSASFHGMRARGAAVGNHHLHAQLAFNIADVGKRFSGIWYLSKVRHILDSQGYRTEFDCQR